MPEGLHAFPRRVVAVTREAQSRPTLQRFVMAPPRILSGRCVRFPGSSPAACFRAEEIVRAAPLTPTSVSKPRRRAWRRLGGWSQGCRWLLSAQEATARAWFGRPTVAIGQRLTPKTGMVGAVREEAATKDSWSNANATVLHGRRADQGACCFWCSCQHHPH